MKVAKFGEMFFDAKGNVTLKDFHFSGDEQYNKGDYQAMSIDMLKAVACHFIDLIADISGNNKGKLPTVLDIHIENGDIATTDTHKQAERERVLFAANIFLMSLFCSGPNRDDNYYDEFTDKFHSLWRIANDLNITKSDNDKYYTYYKTRFGKDIENLIEKYAKEITDKALSEDM